MAADYWVSTQKQNWLFSRAEIAKIRDEVERQHAKVIEQYPLSDRRMIFIFMKERMMQMAKRLPSRQQCLATALVYLQRYFLFNAMQNVNIYLLTATAFYLASKTEEAPHHIRSVSSDARVNWPDYMPTDPSRIGEMEFCLISEMHSQLIVWHPYRSLTALKENQNLSLTNEELSLAWSIINDTFMTDLPLTCPPYLIAITAVFLAVMFVPAKATMEINQHLSESKHVPDSIQFSSLGGKMGLSSLFANTAVIQHNSSLSVKHNGENVDNNMLRSSTSGVTPISDRMQHVVKFLVNSDVDVKRMIDATQELISLYETWEQYNEKSVRELVNKCIRGQHLES